ncbi:glutathione S-transferase [Hyaloraphidium curvatum]|nr:glutathione S-transferase [Hyaloraphidium curvatum]
MQLHADPITINCRKAIAGLKLIGAPFEVVFVSYFNGEQKKEPYISVNPMAQLPSLVDGDLVLSESNAILQYAAEKVGNKAAYPTDLKTRADVNRWLLWEASAWFPSCYVYLVENCVKPLLGGQTDPAALEKERPNFDKLAGILDARLAKSKWIAGDAEPTIADIAVAAPMHLHAWSKLPLESYPNIVRWITEVEKLPCWLETHVEEGFVAKPKK